jgi:hypothetical protein
VTGETRDLLRHYHGVAVTLAADLLQHAPHAEGSLPAVTFAANAVCKAASLLALELQADHLERLDEEGVALG